MLVAIDSASSAPAYEQISEQLTRLVLGGKLPAGTVARAYRELEHAGVVRTGRPHGTFVSSDNPPPRSAVAPCTSWPSGSLTRRDSSARPSTTPWPQSRRLTRENSAEHVDPSPSTDHPLWTGEAHLSHVPLSVTR
jgi:hypothetical protein